MSILLDVKNLGISFGGLRAVNEFDLTIQKEQLYGLIGPNGAGKTTFVRCLCGLEKKFKGTTVLDGKKYKNKEMLKQCYMVMQDVNHQLFAESVEAECFLGSYK